MVLLGVLMLSRPAVAQFELNEDSEIGGSKGVLSLTDGIVAAKEEKPADKDTKAKPEKAEKNADEDKGIFSFMNLDFLKKNKPDLTARPDERKESFIERITRQAEEGDVDAQITLGYMYLYGESGVKIDYKKAFTYYNMAAAQQDQVAINNLGSLYFSGIGTDKNTLKAAQLFEKAAELGNTEAAVNLSFIYLTKNSSLNNPAEAIRLLKSASQAGNPTAKFLLGYAYFKGMGVEQNYKKSVALMREAANVEFADAQYLLAYMYVNGLGITKNYGNAVRYFTLAANQGNVDAMMELGNILAAGTMYNKDLYRAHILFNVASVHGAKGAAEKRDFLEKKLKIEELLQAQAEAEKFKEKPSELTNYIKQTFGDNIRRYIDENMSVNVQTQQ